ncbi:CAP domain-containing protein [Streptomyces sp. NPDC090306]|uniref:CAP domain-containing protein n=1 Tax=Streptomyces sp. NPDC090306 TaxID=3365961 RepID=UPI00380EED29
MGRHRRSDAGRAATSRATGGTEPHGSSASDRDPWDPGTEVPRQRDASPRAPYAQQPRAPFPGERTGGPYMGERPSTGERPAPGRRPDGGARPYAAPRPPAGDRPYAGNRATTGIAPYLNPEAHRASDPYARQSPVGRSEEYLFATDDDYARATGTGSLPVVGPGPGSGDGSGSGSGGDLGRDDRSHRRKRKGMRPVRTGLLGVSAAVAIGAVAVATGVLPGSDNYKLGGSSGDNVQAADSPTNSETQQGGASGSVDGHDDSGSTSRDTDRATSPAAPTPSASASTAAPAKKPAKKASPTPSKSVAPSPTATESEQAPAAKTTPVTVSAETAAEAEVLRLVNVEREKVGCSAVAANSSLTSLAENFSDAMAAQGFFDHTDPSGATPWDRADAAGITNLGGENIARGQADAAAVMDAWMNSEGHRANILNCDFKTLGVGVHFGTGGPWWTQDFGY